MSEPAKQHRIIEIDHISDNQPIYQLGRIAFIVRSDDADFQHQLKKVLPPCTTIPNKIYEIEAENNYRLLLSEILQLHPQYLWLSAACVRSPQGHTLLISGHSNAGKSTTVLALAMRYGWKVISEDVTCIDSHTNRIIAIATPFSLKNGTVELLRETINMVPAPVVFGEWVPLNHMHCNGEYPAKFDLCILYRYAERGNPLTFSSCAAGKYIRLLLSMSNLMHLEDGIDKMYEYVAAGKCYEVQGGSLSGRINLILELTANSMNTSKTTRELKVSIHGR